MITNALKLCLCAMVSRKIFWVIVCAIFYTDYVAYTSVLLGLKFFVRSRPTPANFKSTPHPQESEKSCLLPTRTALFPFQNCTCRGKPPKFMQRVSSLAAIYSVVYFKTNESLEKH